MAGSILSRERLHYTITVIIRYKNVISVPAVKLECLYVNINRHQDTIQEFENITEIVGVFLAK